MKHLFIIRSLMKCTHQISYLKKTFLHFVVSNVSTYEQAYYKAFRLVK